MRASTGFMIGLMAASTVHIAAPARAAESETVKEFSIGPQSLSTALLQFSKQAGFQVLTQAAQTKAINTRGVAGRYTVEEALQRMLQDTGLSFERVGADTVALKRVSDMARPGRTRASRRQESRETGAEQGKGDDIRGHVYVEGQRIKPYTDANVDIPRTVNDVQPYYIFDAQSIERSGAVDIEGFLKTHLTMNTVGRTNSQLPASGDPASQLGPLGATSSIDLRGLGISHTLVLVNGRRNANVTLGESILQPDINGIPLSAIERIEILPSSASGIYGGSAIGGVVNIILKRDYEGAELRATYQNTWDNAAPERSISGNWGAAFEGGKTRVMLTASASESEPLLFGDRRQFYDRGLHRVLSSVGQDFFAVGLPPLGRLPNIRATSGTTLTLDNGTVLSAPFTHVPAGTSASTPLTDLYAGLAANAGRFSLEPPPTAQVPTGLKLPLGSSTKRESLSLALRRAFTPALEIFVEGSYFSNNARGEIGQSLFFMGLPGSLPGNPFREAVTLVYPNTVLLPFNGNSQTRSATIGLSAELPWQWTGQLDYTWSENRFENTRANLDSSRFLTDLFSGALPLFTDLAANPPAWDRYFSAASFYDSSSSLRDATVRLSGPLFSLPWGVPTLAVNLEHRESRTPEVKRSNVTFFARSQTTDSGYVEALIPLVARERFPLLRSLELQLAGRTERYTVDTGTPWRTETVRGGQTVLAYGSPTRTGPNGQQQPVFFKDAYTSTNFTAGLKYEPAEGVLLRASYATAFLPPLPAQLVRNPEPDRFGTAVTDPRFGFTLVPLLSGGDPDLRPQNSESLNAGLIWLPRIHGLDALRVNLEWYQIEQFDQIGALGAQFLVDNESAFAERVTRDPATGRLSLIDNSVTNLFKSTTRGWDLSVSNSWETSQAGAFAVRAGATLIENAQRQVDPNAPLTEYVSYVGEGGPPEFKGNLSVLWDYKGWSLGWDTVYFGSYKQNGAAGGPRSLRVANGMSVPNDPVLRAQGSDAVDAQVYHDLFAAYKFGKASSRFLDSLSLQFNVQNVLDTAPRFDANFRPYLVSPYGDYGLRSYSLSVTKGF